MRQVSPGKQRASVRTPERSGRLSFSKSGSGGQAGHGSGGHGSGGHGSGGPGSGGGGSDDHDGRHAEARGYPVGVLAVVLVGGILLGLLFAGVISSFVGGSDSDSSASGSGKKSTPKASASRQSQDAQSRQRSDALRAAETPEARDVRILGCGTDSQGFASARVLITNGTSERATYYVRVLFTAAGSGRIISDDVASAKRLPAGQAAPLQPVHAVDAAPGEQVECTLGSVSRF